MEAGCPCLSGCQPASGPFLGQLKGLVLCHLEQLQMGVCVCICILGLSCGCAGQHGWEGLWHVLQDPCQQRQGDHRHCSCLSPSTDKEAVDVSLH
jgi:hypothetical protein